MTSIFRPTGTAQVYLIGKCMDTLIHLLNIPYYYSNIDNHLLNKNTISIRWFIIFFDKNGKSLYEHETEIKEGASAIISIKKIFKQNGLNYDGFGQFVVKHNAQQKFHCNFYTSYIQDGKNNLNRVFRLHSHQKINLSSNNMTERLKRTIKNILYVLRIKNFYRYSSAISSWNRYDLEGKYIYLLIANHGNSKMGLRIDLRGRNINKKLITLNTIKANAPEFGASIVKLIDYSESNQIKPDQRLEIRLNGIGTLSRKPIIIMTDREVVTSGNCINSLSILHMQHI